MLSRSKVLHFGYLSNRPAAHGDLAACKDIGRENDSMLSLTLIFRNFHLAAPGADRWRQVPQPTLQPSEFVSLTAGASRIEPSVPRETTKVSNFYSMTSSAAEDVQIAGMRIALQYFLDLQRQAVHPTPHVGVADCQPDAHPRRDRDHRPDSALTTAAANPAGIEAGMRMRAFPANSISIAGAAGHPASSPAGAIRT